MLVGGYLSLIRSCYASAIFILFHLHWYFLHKLCGYLGDYALDCLAYHADK
jgi:hypothetical protein